MKDRDRRDPVRILIRFIHLEKRSFIIYNMSYINDINISLSTF